MMLAHFKTEKFQVKEPTIQLFYGMEDYLCTVVTTGKKDLEICINVALKTRSLNGKKFKVKETNL
jgi:hypothetical protein